MTGITSYGAYVPPTRLPLALLDGRPLKEGGPEKAVAAQDEDSITLAVAAALCCLRGIERSTVDGVFFATTTHPFREKQGASLIAKALDLRRDVLTTDLGGSLRAGVGALRAAIECVAAGSARSVLVVASDCRMAAPGSPMERQLGDGAAAFLVGTHDPALVLEDFHAVADEIVDVWRAEGDRFVHAWEERFVIQEGYTPGLVEAVKGLLAKIGRPVSDFARALLYAPDPRSHAAVARALGFDAGQLQDPLFGRLGNAGAAFAPLLLAAALETAKPGERLLLAGYGDGAEALAFRVTDATLKLDSRRGVSWHLARRRALPRYDLYLEARGLEAREWERGGDPGLSATVHFRERDADVSLRGQRCRRCGAEQFPIQRVCETCFAKDDFEPVRLSDRGGRVLTYTLDWFFPTPEPPTVAAVVEAEGGARLFLQLVDVRPDEVRLDLPVEFVFRKVHEVGGRPNYYWKARPRP